MIISFIRNDIRQQIYIKNFVTSTENVNKQIEVTQVRNLFKGWLANYNKLKMLDVTKFELK